MNCTWRRSRPEVEDEVSKRDAAVKGVVAGCLSTGEEEGKMEMEGEVI